MAHNIEIKDSSANEFDKISNMVFSIQEDIDNDDGSAVYYTDWEGCDVSEEVIDKLYGEPYNWTFEEVNGLEL